MFERCEQSNMYREKPAKAIKESVKNEDRVMFNTVSVCCFQFVVFALCVSLIFVIF